VDVNVPAGLSPTCVVLEVRATSHAWLADARVPFVAGTRTYVFAVAQGSLPPAVLLRGRAMWTLLGGCTGTLEPGFDSIDKPVFFSPGVVLPATVAITCTGLTAAPCAARLAFTTKAQTVRGTACSQPVTVETRSPFGDPVTVANALALRVDATPPRFVQFFSDANCNSALASAAISQGSSLTFFFKVSTPSVSSLTSVVFVDVDDSGGLGGLIPARQEEKAIP
jgi:hypothetical protein